MSNHGVKSNLLPRATRVDDLMGNEDASTVAIPVDNLAQQMAGSGPLADALAEARGLLTSGRLIQPTWAVFAAITPTQDGTGGEVLDTDLGSHLQATATGYDGASVSNAGTYSWHAAWGRWVRIGSTGLSGKANAVDLATVRERLLLAADISVGDTGLPANWSTGLIWNSGGAIWMTDSAGNYYVANGISADPDSGVVETATINLMFDANATEMSVADAAGNFFLIAEPESTDISFSTAELAAAERLGAAEAYRLNTADVSHIAVPAVGANLVLMVSQSFDSQADQTGRENTAARIAAKGYQYNGWSIGPDERCVMQGPTYITYGANSRGLFPLVENMAFPTDQDGFYTDSQVAAGDYPVNARAGGGGVIFSISEEGMRQHWADSVGSIDTDRFTVVMNAGKTDAAAADVFGGDGLSRALSAMAVFDEAITLLDGAAPSSLGSGNGPDAMQLSAILTWHGQSYDKTTGTPATYEALTHSCYAALTAKALADWGQTTKPPMLLMQTGGPGYGGFEMAAALAQNAMSDDFTGLNANIFTIGVDHELWSCGNVTAQTGFAFPNSEDWHPIYASKLVGNIRRAIAVNYLCYRRQNIWMPKPIAALSKGRRALVVVPSMAPPLNISPMPYGCVMHLLPSLGFAFKDSDVKGAARATILSAQVVPGYNYLIEIECAEDLAAFPYFSAGEGEGPELGMVNIRDSFVPPAGIPFEIPFTARQRQYGRVAASGNGFWEVIGPDHPVGRYIQDVGPLDLRQPCRREKLAVVHINTIL